MKLKIGIVILILLLFIAIAIFLCVNLPGIAGMLILGVVALMAFLEIREKRHKLSNIISILSFSFFAVGFLIQGFWPQAKDDVYHVTQTLAMVLLVVVAFFRGRMDQKTKGNFEAEFTSYFKQWNITLPQKNLKTLKGGTINKADWMIKFSFGKEDEKECLEVYAVHPGIWHRHFQILETGEVKKLPAFDDLQGVTEAQLTADLRKKELYPLVLNPWLVSYITQNQPTKSRYEIDKYLLASGYTPGEIERAWDSLAPTAI